MIDRVTIDLRPFAARQRRVVIAYDDQGYVSITAQARATDWEPWQSIGTARMDTIVPDKSAGDRVQSEVSESPSEYDNESRYGGTD